MLAIRAAFVVLLVGSLGCVMASPHQAGAPIKTPVYHIAPPDTLAITVRPEPAIVREVTVRPDGYISFELIGDIKVEGRTVAEVKREITERIAEYVVRPDVTVTLLSSNSRRIYVLGQVRKPGAYPLVGRVTAVDALAAAGDVTVLSAPNRARLARANAESAAVFTVRFDDIIKGGNHTTNYELEPGDIIYVPPAVSASIGFAIQSIFFPIQQIIGLGSPVARAAF